MTKDLVQQARAFARAAHKDQMYRDTPGDYLTEHLDVVAALVAPYGAADQVVAYLHDVLEDTAATAPDLVRRFGTEAARHTQLVTDVAGPNRRERKRLTNLKLAALGAADYRALRVKVADRLANVRAAARQRPELLHMYRNEHAAFRAAVYRPGVAEELWAELEALIAGSPDQAGAK